MINFEQLLTRKALPIVLLLLSQIAFAQTWTVETVPNTRLSSNAIHVSDPDGYLSDSAECYINAALDSIRDQADVFLVALTTIGDEEPKLFATRLFNHWGIGDAETDNGVLLLFVEDQHALEFETGYGAEGTLTDARCAQIFNKTIVPYFRDGDYEGGLCAGVIDIVKVYGGAMPVGLLSRTPQEATADVADDYDYDDAEDRMSGLGAWFFLLVLLPVPIISFLRWIVGLLQRTSKKNKEQEADGLKQDYTLKKQDGAVYVNDLETRWKTSVWKRRGFARFLLYGALLVLLYVSAVGVVPELMPDAASAKQDNWTVWMVLFVYLTICCVVQNVLLLRNAKKAAVDAVSPAKVYDRSRNDAHGMMMRILAPWVGVFFRGRFKKLEKESVQFRCPTCGADTMPDACCQLPAMRTLEQSIHAYNYSPCSCPSGHVVVLREKGSQYRNLHECKHCKARIAKKTGEKRVVEPTYESAGLKEITYECMKCHTLQVETKSIPKLSRRTYDDDDRYSGSSGSYSSGSSGSFGGGSSGGGGYSGRW